MNIIFRRAAFAAALVGIVSTAACATGQLSQQAAAIPIFTPDQPHPAVTRTVGAVRAYACLDTHDRSVDETDVQSLLRRKAESQGATALIEYRSQRLNSSPRQCRRFVMGDAVAVVVGASRVYPSTPLADQ